jgi:hypothetical protein
MSTPAIQYRTQEVNLGKLEFASSPTENRGGKGKSVNARYNGKPFYLQTPKMFNAWGLDISQKKDANGNPEGDPKYYLRLSFGGKGGIQPTKTKAKFHKLMYDMDQSLRGACVDNALKWFKEKPESLTDDVLNNMVATQVKQSVDPETMEADGKYADNVRFRIPFNTEEGVFPKYIEVYDEHGQRVKTDTVEEMSQALMKRCKVVCILRLSGVYLAGGKVGYSWRVWHMQVFPPADALSGFAIMNDNDEEEFTTDADDAGDGDDDDEESV